MERIRMSLLTIIILVAVILVLLAIIALVASGGIICSGLTGKMATGAESLSPAGQIAGNALVVYDPGVTGAAKKAAAEIAGDLQSKGYKVELAGVSSTAASSASGYDVVVVGGPIYFGKASNSIEAYLKGLELQENTKLGVFGTTGSNDFVASDLTSLESQVASLQNRKAEVMLIGDRDEIKAARSCRDLVAVVTQ
ncbi:flavodoxin domain-containing protein [Methanocella arvoryzae]|uniref:Predicted flavodoxin-like protein n=1 Tax=Methanocella arvoryzae (strain DSM 22066 / NBRC 105507 / MRE50) TaxID=351160 RepID=Q0W3G5_METAR|nr:flavodoxin domain-containing protein [Methanocella arvoryzae]CAJ37078.1 predicted flavodoxin-like protein [Methanocella arvoryzae MRE50]